ncbi:MAG: ribonuclease Y [Candidatus Pacebacteria bacterium]|nr:ribonuclease Y [Candidatus Paceibacterota bacterium]
MNLTTLFGVALASVVVGGVIGYFLRHLIALQRKSSIEVKIKQLLVDAKAKAQESVEDASKKAETILEKAKEEERAVASQVRKLEERIVRREELIEKRRSELEKDAQKFKQKAEEIKELQEQLKLLDFQKRRELEVVSKMSEKDAKEELLQEVEKKYSEDILLRIKKLEMLGQEKMENKAQEILVTAIQRLASSTASEITTTAVTIGSDELKGKIIGKEGRNIRSLERAAGVEIIVDDTPGSVVISSFDPVRRHVAKIALENLISDGRIQPARIEEMVAKAKVEVEKMVKDKGENAAYEVGVFDIEPRLIVLLGRLYFRVSYGQNVLQHSIETAHLAGMIASEVGADVPLVKKAALLHDIGKAVDHEIQGTHVEIGRRILQKFNVDERIVHAMESHHEEYPYTSFEAVIIQAADAISASRPGARRDTLENYLKRLEELESISNSFEGVEKSYAIQAGREIRVFVSPDKISDLEAKKLARDIAQKIEQEVRFPGEIKVHIIRETRIVEYAR